MSNFVLQEHGLYYDGNSGCYYKYDQTADKFEFHSQVAVEQPAEITEPEPSSKKVRQNVATVRLASVTLTKNFLLIFF